MHYIASWTSPASPHHILLSEISSDLGAIRGAKSTDPAGGTQEQRKSGENGGPRLPSAGMGKVFSLITNARAADDSSHANISFLRISRMDKDGRVYCIAVLTHRQERNHEWKPCITLPSGNGV
jgi:hypothetical protein